MKKKITHLGIDIGGAHLKVIGIDKNNKVQFVDYSNCRIWEDIRLLKEKFVCLSKTFGNESIKCGITMSAELCDNFKSRKHGALILTEKCKHLKFNNFFYVKSSKTFLKEPKFKELISMNWHSVGRLFEKKVENAIIVDFGSTTTDLICIKNKKLVNKFFDDFSRINNFELLYTGFTRTPIFGITNEICIGKNKLKIIPEFFSNTSDVYRILKKLKRKIDIDITADRSQKTIKDSFRRLSRSFGFDYHNKYQVKLKQICNEISSTQLNQIMNAVKKLEDRFSMKNFTVISSGIGQEVLSDFFKRKKFKTKYLHSFLSKSDLNKKASFHAPALAIALLLKELK